MFRSHCMGPVVVVLALTGLALGQTSSNGPPSGEPSVNPPQPGGARQPIITVQEAEKPAEKCRILKSWLMPDGGRAFQAQILSSDEMLTIVETGPHTGAASPTGRPFQAVATRIYHWGNSTTPPEGAPVPPGSAPVVILQPAGPTIVNGRATTTGTVGSHTWPSAFADGSPTQSPYAPTQGNSPTLIQVQATAPALTPVPVVLVPPGSLPNGPTPEVIQVPATNSTSTAALARQTPMISSGSSSGAVPSTTDSTPATPGTTSTADQPRPAHRGSLMTKLFPPAESTPTDKTTTVLVQATVPQGQTDVLSPTQPQPILPTMKGPSHILATNSVDSTPGAHLPLATVTTVTTAPPLTQALPLAIVKPVDSSRPGATKPAAGTPGTAAPVKMPLSDNSKPDPFDNLGTYVKVPGHEIGVKAAQPGQGISGGSAITPVGGFNPAQPANPSSTGAPTTPSPPGMQGSLSVPTGRQSVLAAQAAATQVSAEMKAAPKGPNSMLQTVSVNPQEPNAFGAGQGQRSPNDPQANAWTAPSNQMVQAPPGSAAPMPLSQAPGIGPMVPPGQPMMPYPGQPMMPYPGQPMMPYPGQPMMVPATPYQGAALPMKCPVAPMPPPQCCPVPCGFKNAFTQAGNPNPIPADMGHDPSNTDNAFQSISCATLAVPPGTVCGCPGCPGPCYPPPPGMAMMPVRGPYAYPAIPPGPPVGMVADPALAPVRVSEQQMAQARPLYQGTAAAEPVLSPFQRVGAQVAMPATAPGLPETGTLPEIMNLLNDSLYPSQREWAADRLTHFDWRVHPQVVECLLQAARDDPAPLVRMSCMHSLGRLKAGTTFVVKALQEIKEKDKDARVRQEAELTLQGFLPGGK